MNIALKLAFIISLATAASIPALAADSASPPAASVADATMSHGEIRKINKDAGKITLRHGELKNLEMPPMTMVFHVKDPSMLEQVAVGDKVDFVAENIGGQLTVTAIKAAKQ